MADQDSSTGSPSTYLNPSNVTSDSEGLREQDDQESAGDAGDFDFENIFNQDPNVLSEQYYSWVIDNELNKYLDQQNQSFLEHNSYLPTGPSTKRQKIARTFSNPASPRDEVAKPTYDRKAENSRLNHSMADDSESPRSFNCPYRVAQARFRLPHKCTGCQAKNMAEVRRHLTRPLRNKKPPHLTFLKLCPTCNEDFLDSYEFETDHGHEGEKCKTPRKQRKGDIGQREQWNALYSKLENYVAAEANSISDTARMSSPVSQPPPILTSNVQQALSGESSTSYSTQHGLYVTSPAETPHQGDTSHAETWSDVTMDVEWSFAHIRPILPHEGIRQYSGELPWSPENTRQDDRGRDLRMHMSRLVNDADDLDATYTSYSRRVWRPFDSLGEAQPEVWTYFDHVHQPSQDSSQVDSTSRSQKHQGSSNVDRLSWCSSSPWVSSHTEDSRLITPRGVPVYSDLPLPQRSVHVSPVNVSADDRDGEPVDAMEHDHCETNHSHLFQYRIDRPSTPRTMPRTIPRARIGDLHDDTTSSYTDDSHKHIFLSVPSAFSSYSEPSSVDSPTTSDHLSCNEPGCMAAFSGTYRKGNLERHKRLYHKGKDPSYYSCEDDNCAKTFRRPDARLKHYRRNHPHLVAGPAVPRGPQRSGYPFSPLPETAADPIIAQITRCGKFLCLDPGCDERVFNRQYDIRRHYQTTHVSCNTPQGSDRPPSPSLESDSDPVIGHITRLGKFRCLTNRCDDLTFGRQAELKRHYETSHGPQQDPPDFLAPKG